MGWSFSSGTRSRVMLKLKRLTKVLLVTAALAVAGCASFPGNELAKRGYDGLTSTPTKSVVDYDVTCTVLGRDNYTGTYWFSEQVKSVFEKSGLFASHILDGKGAPVHLSIKMNNNGSPGAATAAGIVAGLTLTLIPVFATDEYELTVDVRSGDKLVKSYAYNDHITTWFQLFLIFAFPSHKPGEVAHGVTENMLLHFLNDAHGDGVLSAKLQPLRN